MDLSVVRGLNNLGNSCFMNSALQCLTHIKPLSRAIMQDADSSGNGGQLYGMYRDYLKTYYKGQGSHGAVSPKQLFSNMRKINSRMAPGRQHDAHEYALGVLDFVEEHFKKQKRTKEFERIFGGRLVSEVTCASCKHVSSSYEHMVSLSLVVCVLMKDINKARTLEDALKEFFTPDYLKKENQYKCDSCKKKVDAKKQYSIAQGNNCDNLSTKMCCAAIEEIQLPG